jgi:hypothetical protein
LAGAATDTWFRRSTISSTSGLSPRDGATCMRCTRWRGGSAGLDHIMQRWRRRPKQSKAMRGMGRESVRWFLAKLEEAFTFKGRRDRVTVLLFLSRLRNSLWLSRILDH